MRFGIFHQKQMFFQEMMVSPCRMMNTITCCGGIWIDQWMLGLGEVWYFSSKQRFFREMMISPCCVMNSIACCAPHKTLKSLFVCSFVGVFVSLSKPIRNELFYFKIF